MADSPTATAEFALVPDQVSDAGAYVQQTAQTLLDGVRAATAEVDGLMATWKGAAATAYAGGWDETRTAPIDVLESLETMAGLLGVVAVRVTGADTGAAAALSSTLDLPAP